MKDLTALVYVTKFNLNNHKDFGDVVLTINQKH